MKIVRCYACDEASYVIDHVDDNGAAVLRCTDPDCSALIDVFEIQEQLDEDQDLDWYKGLVVYVDYIPGLKRPTELSI
jgi:hypothetical protein